MGIESYIVVHQRTSQAISYMTNDIILVIPVQRKTQDNVFSELFSLPCNIKNILKQ